MTRKMSKWEWTVLVALILAFLCNSLTGFAQDCDRIRGNTLRLHVIANSDSEADQELKLKVRDRILEEEGALLGDAGSRDDAILLANSQLNEIEAIAKELSLIHIYRTNKANLQTVAHCATVPFLRCRQ